MEGILKCLEKPKTFDERAKTRRANTLTNVGNTMVNPYDV